MKVNLTNIKENISKIIQKYPDYRYYIGVVKANCYGHQIESISSIIDGGCNYLAVALLEEALQIRNRWKDIPILCLGVISSEEIDICIQNNITITINSIETVKQLAKGDIDSLKVHIKLNTGMNRLGISKAEELRETIMLLQKHNVFVEGIYTHIYDASHQKKTQKQFLTFKRLLESIHYKKIPMIHVSASEALTNYPKLDFVNGCRLGIIMYGFTNDHTLNLESTFFLYSRVIQINQLKPNETVGYQGEFKAKKEEWIAVVPIGYADGIIRKNTGRMVYIHNKPYPIVGNICMDMLFVKVDESVNLDDEVIILKDKTHISEVANYLDTIPYEVLCSISSRVPRVYD